MDNHRRATLKLAGTAFACGVARWATAQPASAPATGPDGGGLDPYPGGYRVKAPPVPAGEPDIVRVHDVREMARVAKVSDAVVRGWDG